MQKQLTILCLFIALATQSNAQINLVPNGSFEELDTCPYTFSQIRFAKHWFSPSLGTPDLYNVCDFDSSLMSYNPTYYLDPVFTDSDIGFDQPHEGVGFARIGINTELLNDSASNREYVAIRLNQKLEKNKYYCFSMYCSYPTEAYRMFFQHAVDGLPPSAILYTTSSIGVYFSEDSIYQNSWAELPYTPQIQNPPNNPITTMEGWQIVSGYFKSETGEEEYIYIGNFNNFFNTPLTQIWPGIDPFEWILFYIDDISLVECEGVGIEENKSSPISIFPNPASENITITLQPNPNKAELLIYTMQGQLLSQTQFPGTQTINTSTLTNGLYLFVIQSNGNITGMEKVIIAH